MVKKAYTLVELIVVLVLAGLLIVGAAAGIKAVVGASEDAAATNAIDRVVLVQRTWAAQNEGYFSPEAFTKLDRDLEETSGASGGPENPSVKIDANGNLFVAVKTAKGECEAVKVTSPSAGGTQESVTAPADCSAASLS